jgi:hypothetical protein
MQQQLQLRYSLTFHARPHFASNCNKTPAQYTMLGDGDKGMVRKMQQTKRLSVARQGW